MLTIVNSPEENAPLILAQVKDIVAVASQCSLEKAITLVNKQNSSKSNCWNCGRKVSGVVKGLEQNPRSRNQYTCDLRMRSSHKAAKSEKNFFPFFFKLLFLQFFCQNAS